jgi:hypothetical protein
MLPRMFEVFHTAPFIDFELKIHSFVGLFFEFGIATLKFNILI